MNIFHQNNNVKKMKKGKLIMTIIIGNFNDSLYKIFFFDGMILFSKQFAKIGPGHSLIL